MTLRELVQQAGGINSPMMDYNLSLTTSENEKDTGKHRPIKEEDLIVIHHNQTIFIKDKIK